jgi:hypothetical protein
MGFLFHLDASTQVSIIILKRIAASGYRGKREQQQSSGMICNEFRFESVSNLIRALALNSYKATSYSCQVFFGGRLKTILLGSKRESTKDRGLRNRFKGNALGMRQKSFHTDLNRFQR